MPVAPGVSAETIIFVINSAIKLSHNFRQLYAEKVREKDIVLPLPDFDPGINLRRIVRFFNTMELEELEQWNGLPALHQKVVEGHVLAKEEQEEYERLFWQARSQGEENAPLADLSQEELLSLFRLPGTANGTERSVLQLVAGSIVDIGVDYFVQVPGALNRESTHGRVLYNFLLAFDEIDFSENENVKKEFSDKLVPRLFATAAETVAELSNSISNDERFQMLIKATAKGIANDIYKRAEELDAVQREEAIKWGQMVLRSMIKNGSEYVLAAPEVFMDTNTGVSAIIQSSGLILLETILNDNSDKIAFKKAVSPETLERLTRASLQILSEHPHIISSELGVEAIIKGVAEAVQEESHLLEKGLLPELVRIVLEQSTGHLDMLWGNKDGHVEHLLLTALRQILSVLSKPADEGKWKPEFTKWQLLKLIEELLEEIVQNPDWIIDEIRDKPILAEVIELTFEELRKLPKEARLQLDVIRTVLRLNLEITLMNPLVLEAIPYGTEGDKEIVLQKALDLLFSFIYSKENQQRVNRMLLLVDLLEYITTVILREHPDEKGLLLIQLILFDSGVDYSRGFDTHLADQLIDAGLEVMTTHPFLIERPDGIHQILAGVLSSLDSVQLRRPGLPARLVQLILKHSAQHAHLIIESDEGTPRYLLTILLKQILEYLSATDSGSQWKPHLSSRQFENLLIVLLDEIVKHPFWLLEKVQDDALLTEVLNAVFQALEDVPPAERLDPSILELLLQICLRVVATSPQVLNEEWFADEEDKKILIQHALELVFAFVAAPEDANHSRQLLLTDLLEFVLEHLLQRFPDKRGLILIDLVLFEYNGLDYSQGFPIEMAQQLVDTAFSVLAQHPDLATNNQLLKQVIANVSANLSSSGLNQAHLLRELIRLTLESTAEHVELLLDDSNVNNRHLFVMASWQVLNALAQPVEHGHWKPHLSNAQILELIECIYQAILENPKWVDTPLFYLLHAVFSALQQMPNNTVITYSLIHYLVNRSIEIINRQPVLLMQIEAEGEPTRLRLQLALEHFIKVLYNREELQTAEWYLAQSHVIQLLADYYLEYLSSTPALDSNIIDAGEVLQNALSEWENNPTRKLEEVLQAFQA